MTTQTIMDEKGNLKCQQHTKKISSICVQSKDPKLLLELLCSECIQLKPIEIKNWDFPDQLSEYLIQELKNGKQRKPFGPTVSISEQNKQIFLFLEKKQKIICQIEEELNTVKKTIQIIEKAFNISLKSEDQFPTELIENIIEEIEDQLSSENLEEALYELQQFFQNDVQVFPLDFQKNEGEKLMKHLTENYKIEQEILRIKLLLEELSKDVPSNKINNHQQRFIPEINLNQMTSFKEEIHPFQLTSFFSTLIINNKLGGLIGIQESIESEESKFYFTLFNYQNEIKKLFQLDLGYNGTYFGNSSIIKKLTDNSVIFGIFRKLYIFNIETLKIIQEIDTNIDSRINAIEINRIHNFIFVGLDNQSILYYQFNNNNLDICKLITTLKGHSDKVRQIQNYQNTFISCSNDNTVRIWDLKLYSNQVISTFLNCIEDFDLSEESQTLYVLLLREIKKVDLDVKEPSDLTNLKYQSIFQSSTNLNKLQKSVEGFFLATDEGFQLFNLAQNNFEKFGSKFRPSDQCSSFSIWGNASQSVILVSNNDDENLVQMTFKTQKTQR